MTPLVGWLKAYMIPEILNIEMPMWVLQKTPSNYKGCLNEIRQSQIDTERLNEYLESFKHENQMRTNNADPEI